MSLIKYYLCGLVKNCVALAFLFPCIEIYSWDKIIKHNNAFIYHIQLCWLVYYSFHLEVVKACFGIHLVTLLTLFVKIFMVDNFKIGLLFKLRWQFPDKQNKELLWHIPTQQTNIIFQLMVHLLLSRFLNIFVFNIN